MTALFTQVLSAMQLDNAPTPAPSARSLHPAIVEAKRLQAACPKCAVANNMGRLCKVHLETMFKADLASLGEDWYSEKWVRIRKGQVLSDMRGHFFDIGAYETDEPKPAAEVFEHIRKIKRLWSQQ